MCSTVSFKQRVADCVCNHASDYKTIFMDYEYLVCSPAFVNNPYYIISSDDSNYMHLTGVSNPRQDPRDFFNKCVDRTLTEADITFIKRGQSEESVKGSCREKIKVLPNLMNIFNQPLLVEESFSKNRVVCSFGASDGSFTIGFTLVSDSSLRVSPMTLLKGSQLDLKNAHNVELILRRKKGDSKFDSFQFGNQSVISKYRDSIKDLLSDSLQEAI